MEGVGTAMGMPILLLPLFSLLPLPPLLPLQRGGEGGGRERGRVKGKYRERGEGGKVRERERE